MDVESTDVLNMRLGPSSSNGIVYAIPADGRGVHKRNCTAAGGATWCEVIYDCRVGWVNNRFLALDYGQDLRATSRVVGVAANDKLWVRPGPGDLSSKLAGLEHDTIGIQKQDCQMVGAIKWCQIRFGSIVGWVNSKFLAD